MRTKRPIPSRTERTNISVELAPLANGWPASPLVRLVPLRRSHVA